MQTFYPHPAPEDSARALYRKHLGKQRLECKQTLQSLLGLRTGWANHPATRMWAGHEPALAAYGYTVCTEWIGRGYKDTMRPWFEELVASFQAAGASFASPWWCADPANQARHRAALILKDIEHGWGWYTELGWAEEPAVNTLWPTTAHGQYVHIAKTTRRSAA